VSYEKRILEALEELGCATSKEIREHAEIPENAVYRLLPVLAKYKCVTCLGHVGKGTSRWRLCA
jgi:DNA-binding IclR family transcriptional regulator